MSEESSYETKKRYIIPVLIVLAVAIIVWQGPRLQYNGMSLYFPDKDGRALKLEKRPIAPLGSRSQRARDVVEELLLGPLSRDMQPIVHVDISLERALSGKNALFFDFTTKDVSEFSPEYKTFKTAIDKSLHKTIPGNYHIYLYINGTLAR